MAWYISHLEKYNPDDLFLVNNLYTKNLTGVVYGKILELPEPVYLYLLLFF